MNSLAGCVIIGIFFAFLRFYFLVRVPFSLIKDFLRMKVSEKYLKNRQINLFKYNKDT